MEELVYAQMIEVKFPEMRKSVIGAVKSLADRDYQRRVWVEGRYPNEQYYDDFSMNVHILFDDTVVLEDPEKYLGAILASHAEVGVMEVLADALERLLDIEGRERSDLEYMESPHWDAVVTAAETAYRELTSDDS